MFLETRGEGEITRWNAREDSEKGKLEMEDFERGKLGGKGGEGVVES